MFRSKCILLALALLMSIGTTWASVCSTSDPLTIDLNCLTPAADECLPNDDTQIQCLVCQPGYYVAQGGACAACSTCNPSGTPATYQVSACSATADTVCQPCYGVPTNCTPAGGVSSGACVLSSSAVQCDTAKCKTNFVLAANGPNKGTCGKCAENNYWSPTYQGIGGCVACALATANCGTALSASQWCIGNADAVACDGTAGSAPGWGCNSGYAWQYDCKRCLDC